MTNSKHIKAFLIPLLGIVIPLISGFYHYDNISIAQIISANCYSIFISFCVWNGGIWIINKYRCYFYSNILIKTAILCFLTVLYGAVVATLLSSIWLFFTEVHHHIDWTLLMKNTLAVSVAVIVFTLMYEVTFLAAEKETEHIKTKQLDTALTKAQLQMLKNELDPHFMYNALNTLSWLVQKNKKKADDFILKLADVYQYILINKNKDQISLGEEVAFIKKYFALLQVRYENKIDLVIDLDRKSFEEVTILPCALQLLVENAIKHNAFSSEEPLSIKITSTSENIYVINTRKPYKPSCISTKIGLHNLKERYQLVCKKPVIVELGTDYFSVSLPMLKTA